VPESTDKREPSGFVDWDDIDEEDDEKYGKFTFTEGRTR
jgi:hypothetical protein